MKNQLLPENSWFPSSKVLAIRGRIASFLAIGAAALFTFVFVAVFKNGLSNFEDQLAGYTWRFFSNSDPEERITIVSIDERSLSEIGPWPWSRSVLAELTQEIGDAGAQLQIHDIVYPASDIIEDNDFERALINNTSIISQLPILESSQSIKDGALSHPVTSESCALSGRSVFPSTENFIGVSPILSGVPKGHIAPLIDSDGAIRKMPALICVEDKLYAALSIAPFFAALGAESWDVNIEQTAGLFAPHYKLSLESYPGLEFPVDNSGNIRFSFLRSPSAYRSVSAVDVLNGNYDPRLFDNTWVVVGATAFALDDVVPTPYSGSAPGVELQARMIGSILDDNVPYVPQGSTIIAVILAFVMGVILLLCAERRGRYALVGLPVVSLLAPFVSLSVHGVALHAASLWLGWLIPALFTMLGGLMLLLLELMRLRLERGRVMQNLSSYLPGDEAKKVAFELPSSNIEAERREVTLLCADLRNFSAIGESRPPEESASVLHFFFTKANTIVEHFGGKIHEYKGDSVLAVWDGNGIKSATSALMAAQQIEKDVNDSLSPNTGIAGIEPLAVGIGIEQGPVLMGSIGPAQSRAHTLIGETVSVTLRIQEMTADLASPILIGEVAARHLNDSKLQSLGNYLLPGLTVSHTLYTPENRADGLMEGLKLLKGGLS